MRSVTHQPGNDTFDIGFVRSDLHFVEFDISSSRYLKSSLEFTTTSAVFKMLFGKNGLSFCHVKKPYKRFNPGIVNYMVRL